MARRVKAKYGNVNRGPAPDLADGYNYRSGWERDVSRFLKLLQTWGVVEGYAYEPQKFSFKEYYNSNPMFYTPDFAVKFYPRIRKDIRLALTDIFDHIEPGKTVYWEVKGQEKGTDREKWRRFRKYGGYPLEVIKKDKLALIEVAFKPFIPTWESNLKWQRKK